MIPNINIIPTIIGPISILNAVIILFKSKSVRDGSETNIYIDDMKWILLFLIFASSFIIWKISKSSSTDSTEHFQANMPPIKAETTKDESGNPINVIYVQGEKGQRGLPGPKGDPGTFSQNTCKFFGSDDGDNWKCPDTYPVYSGASFSGYGLKCNGGVAKNSSCNNKGGIGAQGVSILDEQGGVLDVKMTDGGTNYKVPPRVEFIGGGGFGATAEAVISNGKVMGVEMVNKGKFYKFPPNVHFVSLDYGDGAKANAKVREGKIVNINLTNTGGGYSLAPIVSFEGGGGSGAEAVAQIQDGRVTNITLVRGGSGYTYAPIIRIKPRIQQQGCSQCHLCCKKTPPSERDKTLDKQVVDNIEKISQQETLTNKLLSDFNRLNGSVQNLNKLVNSLKTRPIVLDDSAVFMRGAAPPPAEPILQPLGSPAAFRTGLEGAPEADQAKMLLDQNKRVRSFMDELSKQYDLGEDTRKMENWATTNRATATQSSNSKNPTFAIDGNKQSYSATNIEKNPFFTIDFISPVELYGFYILLNKTNIPLEIVMTNNNGGVVFKQPIKGDILEYKYDSIHKIVKRIKIQAVNTETSLEIKHIEAIGKKANQCDYYINKLFTVSQRNKDLLVVRKLTQKDEMEEKMYKSFHESCFVMDEEKEKERADVLEKEADAFNKAMEQRDQAEKEEAEYYQKVLDGLQAQIEEEKRTNEEAKALGITPVAPKYTDEYIREIKDKASFKPRPRLTGAHGAFCYRMMRKKDQYRNRADGISRSLEYAPGLQPIAEMASKASDNSNDFYEKYCLKGEKPPAILLDKSFIGEIAIDTMITMTPRTETYGADYSAAD